MVGIKFFYWILYSKCSKLAEQAARTVPLFVRCPSLLDMPALFIYGRVAENVAGGGFHERGAHISPGGPPPGPRPGQPAAGGGEQHARWGWYALPLRVISNHASRVHMHMRTDHERARFQYQSSSPSSPSDSS